MNENCFLDIPPEEMENAYIAFLNQFRKLLKPEIYFGILANALALQSVLANDSKEDFLYHMDIIWKKIEIELNEARKNNMEKHDELQRSGDSADTTAL